MKKIYLFVVLAVVSIVLTSCLSTMVDIASSTYPSLMLSSPDGTSRLVWDFKAKTMTIDDPETLEVKKEWKGASAGSVKSFAFSQDSRYMVFVSEGKVKIWDFKKNEQTLYERVVCRSYKKAQRKNSRNISLSLCLTRF